MEASNPQQIVLEAIAQPFLATGEWPELAPLQRHLASQQLDVDLRAELQAMPDRAFIDNDGAGRQRAVLALRGLLSIPEAAPLLSKLMEVVRLVVDRYSDTAQEPIVHRSDLAALGFDEMTQRQVSELLLRDGWLFGGGQGGATEDWRRDISEGAWRARRARTVEQLLRARDGLPVEEPAPQPEEEPAPEPEPETEAPSPREPAASLDLLLAEGPSAPPRSDRPIQSTAEDILGRTPLAGVIADDALSAQREEGLVVGLAGPWGSGKTSILRLIEEQLVKQGITVLWFEPWMFSSTEDLTMRFMRETIAQLSTARDRSTRKIAGKLGQYAQALEPLTSAPTIGLAARLLMFAGKVVGRLDWQQADAGKLRAAVSDALVQLDRRIVVMVDDLDRLQADELRQVIRLIKLVADFPNITYIVGYDRDRVEHALDAGQEGQGSGFLQKIVQISHDVPLISAERLMRLLVGEVNPVVAGAPHGYVSDRDWQNVVAFGLRHFFRTPREVVRLVSAIPSALRMIEDEVALVDLIALESIRLYAPGVHTGMLEAVEALTGEHLVIGNDAEIENADRIQLEGLIARAGDRQAAVRGLLQQLFPVGGRLIGGANQGTSIPAGSRRRRRVAHPQVLLYYLQRTGAEDQVPTETLKRLRTRLGSRDETRAILADLTPEQLSDLFERLEDYAQELPAQQAAVLLAAITDHASRLPEPSGILQMPGHARLVRLQFRLMTERPAEDRDRIVESAFFDVSTLSGRLDLVRSFGHEQSDSDLRLLSSKTTARLTQDIYKALSVGTPQSLAGEPLLPALLAGWIQNDETLARSRIAQLAEDDAFVLALIQHLVTFVRRQSVGEAAVEVVPRFDWDAYLELLGEQLGVRRLHELKANPPDDERALEALSVAVEASKGDSRPLR
jgi:KAP family P-loop domain